MIPSKLTSYIFSVIIFAICSSFLTTFQAKPAISAENIYFPVRSTKLRLSVKSLEVFAKEGRITREFEFFAKRLKPEKLERLRKLLLYKFNTTPVAVSQLMYSPIGEEYIRQYGAMIKTRTGQNGFYAIRSALVLAAADPEGLTGLSFIRHFPTDIQISVKDFLELLDELSYIAC
ncbi:hypothetical protein CEN45_17890 [Fischerella thermalis CCMEE 5198]|jgi:hypothetical protein|uniref:alpha/beta hydrolase n=1 Tax=Fischerella thermalis TaxID=372787 RepID=UPI000C7FA124|nr:alpha/beta hydrolase [Fischerella thermalis]PMB20019.1 hypothetical protein CEN45_17890 [Fischerella thermalis CCMEE 5198]